MNRCRFCDAEILWAKARRRWDSPVFNLPLDPQPVEDGEWLVGEDGTASYIGRDPSLIAEGRHHAHESTCKERVSA